MPIPSIASSSIIHTNNNGLNEDGKWNNKSPFLLTSKALLESNKSNNRNVMETGVSTISLQDEDNGNDGHDNDMDENNLQLLVKTNQKRKIVLLHARREGDDKTVNISEERIRSISIGGLYAGSMFYGTQKCGSASYEVNVELLNVDMKESTLCGYLNIKGLTSEFPELTTFFQAEVIGPKYSFLTRKWQADQQSDLLHWKKFSSFKPYIDTFSQDDFVFDSKEDDDFIYMRWKEIFLVPNHHVSSIHGASFDGFYYICYQRSTNIIKGYYFYRHHKDWFQELNLNHVSDHGFANFEFR
ncbi:vacuolar import and degradation protein-domain-containing protein [Cokeromyces recurvatus]|uniref:vacuolar import and degradation protein-domain-containing protein n=1 Tax=Cokeromyces recurvatus TaxID=90255 RepID=UPI00221E632C|nr:vacuolar import and degradation protein-domain-containing protein [Cokeromyces recurvatus]KAI7901817.1 vacuolar import and degradation protein-domain-containing protein [Cokeromyces recurvatus]